MGFDELIHISPRRMALDERQDELDTLAKERLAEEVQLRLRGRIDPGVSFPRAKHAQAVTVREAGGRLVIREASQAAVLRGVGQPDASMPGPSGIDSLFEASSGIPTIEYDERGDPRPVFRTIRAEDLFEEQRQDLQDRSVSQTVEEVLQGSLVDAYDEATREVGRRYPEDK